MEGIQVKFRIRLQLTFALPQLGRTDGCSAFYRYCSSVFVATGHLSAAAFCYALRAAATLWFRKNFVPLTG